jgi:phosphonopyruvate decarboxylase
MIRPDYFVDQLRARRIGLFTGVPCSYLTPVIDEVIARDETRYVVASSEGEALAMASGAWLGGKLGVVMCQNSGLGNMVNPLTSLNAPFGIPVLLLVTWRGKPGTVDEPQHEIMGRMTTALLDLMGIPWSLLPGDEEEIPASLEKAISTMSATERPYALILSGDSFCRPADKAQGPAPQEPAAHPTRSAALEAFLSVVPADAAVIATTGKSGRELFTLQDSPRHLYCVGSMGYANALAHGLALASERQVFVIDGDGAALMHLGNLSSIGATQPRNLVHIVLDNGTYDSTGGQPTVSKSVDFAKVALASGYARGVSCSSLKDFVAEVASPPSGGPTLIHLKIRPGSMKQLGRPVVTPHSVARRLRGFIES